MKKIFLITTLLLIFLTSCGQECEHDYETKKIEVTCTEDGYTLYTCNLCGDSYKGDIVPSTGHQTKVSTPGYAPTCEESGMTDEYSCTICNKLVKPAEKIFALGHEYGKWVEVTKPTKETTGLLTKTCETDKSHVQEIVLPKLIKCDDYVYEINNPTCTSEGLETFIYKADEQEFKYEVVLEKLPHTYNEVVTAPTCLEKGYTTYTCSCGDTYVDDYVNATGHSHTPVVTKPTCLDKGYTTHTCHCGDTYVDTYVEATGHSHVKSIVDPTCTEKGYTAYTCHCGDIYKDTYVDPLGHKYTNYINDDNATCETNETKTATCENGCGSKDVKEIEGTSIGHAYGEWKMTEEPSLTKTGKLTKYCNNDNTHTITKELPILNKTDYIFSGTEPTCTTAGNSTYKCEVDGQLFIIELNLSALGHKHISVVTEPTCLEKGYSTHTCHCGDTYIDTYVDALGHDVKTTKQKVEPTCIKQGMTEEIACTRCNYIEQESTVINALGHTNTDGDYYCDRCGVPYGDNVKSIKTVYDLDAINSNLSGFYQLENDIDLTYGSIFYGIGDKDHPFTGYLYGNGYTIKGLTNYTLVYNNKGTIDSLNISNSSFQTTNTDDPLAVFVDYNYGTIKNCKVVGATTFTVTASFEHTTKYNQSAEKNYFNVVGGIAAFNYGNVTDCSVEGNFVVQVNSKAIQDHKVAEIFGVPTQTYMGETLTLNHNVIIGLICGRNFGTLENNLVTAASTFNFNLSGGLHKKIYSGYGYSYTLVDAKMGTVCGENYSTMLNNKVTKEFTLNETNVGDKHNYSGVTNYTGYKNLLTRKINKEYEVIK